MLFKRCSIDITDSGAEIPSFCNCFCLPTLCDCDRKMPE